MKPSHRGIMLVFELFVVNQFFIFETKIHKYFEKIFPKKYFCVVFQLYNKVEKRRYFLFYLFYFISCKSFCVIRPLLVNLLSQLYSQPKQLIVVVNDVRVLQSKIRLILHLINFRTLYQQYTKKCENPNGQLSTQTKCY